jgi:Mce-associated membrane protein
VTDSEADPETAAAPTTLAEAEEELARAEARAEAARARAAALRRQAEAAFGSTPATKGSRTAALTALIAAVVGGVMIIVGSFAACGYMLWQHHAFARDQRRTAEFAAAARQDVATLMSIDADHAAESVQRTIGVTTGALKSQMEATSTFMVKNAQEAKVTTKATVEDVAVQSMTANSAVVLVVAKSDTVNADKSKRVPGFWRLSINLDRDGGQIKISKLDLMDFLP